MGTTQLPAEYVARYARPPAESTAAQAISIHQSVRTLLGDTDFATVLQGSYKNDTALFDMNDVDIVAVSRKAYSARANSFLPIRVVSWNDLFGQIEAKLNTDGRYRGKWKREDKCIRLNTGIKIDIVPAARIGEPDADPIAIYSWRAQEERKNWPRGHAEKAAAKSKATNGDFKQTVRLLKRWARCWFENRKVAPSYYLECLAYAQPESHFSSDLARTLAQFAVHVAGIQYSQSQLPRLAGEGDLFSPGEWNATAFAEFQQTLRNAAVQMDLALNSTSSEAACKCWRAAFNDQPPA